MILTGNIRLLTHHKSQFIYHTCVYNCLYTCICYQIPVLFQFEPAILWNPLESGPIPLDSSGLHWIPLDSTGMTGFQQELGGHCKVLTNFYIPLAHHLMLYKNACFLTWQNIQSLTKLTIWIATCFISWNSNDGPPSSNPRWSLWVVPGILPCFIQI